MKYLAVNKTRNASSSKWQVRRLRLNQSGYTSNWYYFGVGLPLYECFNDSEYVCLRASDRNHAIEQLRDQYKGQEIKFYQGEKR